MKGAALAWALATWVAAMPSHPHGQDSTFVGASELPEVDQHLSLVPDPSLPAVVYFQQQTHDPCLELMLVSIGGDEHNKRLAFVQGHNGIPILDTFAIAQLYDGVLRFARYHLTPTPRVETSPNLSAANAQAIALEVAGQDAECALPGQGAPSLSIYYPKDDPWLVWTVPISTLHPFGSLDVYITASDGQFKGKRKTSMDAVEGAVFANIEPCCKGDTVSVVALPHIQWATGLTTLADGSFSHDGILAHAATRLTGLYFRVIPFGDVPYEMVTPLFSLPAFNEIRLDSAPLSMTDPYYYASQARSWLRKTLAAMPEFPAPRVLNWTKVQVPIRVNLPNGYQNMSCNAFYDGTSLNFFVDDEERGCINTGQAAKIVYHEYGHGIHDHMTWSRATFDPQLSEGVADYIAATISGEPEITGLMGCNTVLSGRTTKRSCVNRYTYCKDRKRCDSFPGDEVHNAAPVICGALWEVRQAIGVEAGDRLFLRFLTLATDMSSAYEAAIAADDDDDNDPSNGTTHSCAINKAFLGLDGGFAHFPDAVKRALPCVR